MDVTAELVPPVMAVESGDSATFVVKMVNRGSSPEVVRPIVQGDVAPFAWVLPESLSLGAGERGEVGVGFRLPRTAAIAAGQLPFQIRGGPGGPVLAEGAVEVQPFAVLSTTIDPPEVSGASSRHQVTVSTRGNAPVDVALSVRADEGLDARVEPASVTVAPERPASATVEIEPARRAFIGSAQRRSFTVVASPTAGEAAEVRGTFVQSPKLSSRAGVVLAVVLALIAAGVTVRLVSSGGSSTDLAVETTPASGPVDARTRCPAEFHSNDPSAARTLTPEDIKRLPDDYSFLSIKEDKCSPRRFNPCEPVHFIQNAAAAPPGVADDVRQAFRMLGEATGITFVDDGLTDETARADAYVPDRYGRRWAPILILWEHFGAERTDGAVQILGNTVPMRVDDTVVSGRLRFNVDSYNNEQTRAPIAAGFGPPGPPTSEPIGRDNITWGRIVLHELAHLAGLGHDRSQGSLMYPDAAQQTIRPVGFSEGDLVGLRLLGKDAGCLRNPPLPA